MRGWTILLGCLGMVAVGVAQDVDEATLEARMEAFQEAFAPMARQWEALTSRGGLLWTTGYFESLEGKDIVVFRVPPLDLAERVRKGESLTSRPDWKSNTPPPVFAYPLASNAVFLTPDGQILPRENLKLTRNQILALGQNPETGEVVEVVVLNPHVLQQLGETYSSRLRERFPAQE